MLTVSCELQASRVPLLLASGWGVGGGEQTNLIYYRPMSCLFVTCWEMPFLSSLSSNSSCKQMKLFSVGLCGTSKLCGKAGLGKKKKLQSALLIKGAFW